MTTATARTDTASNGKDRSPPSDRGDRGSGANGDTRGDDPADLPILGANPFVGLTRRQVASSLSRLGRRLVVEPGTVVAGSLGAAQDLVKVAIGRSDLAPDRGDRRFSHDAWSSNPVYHRMMQSYLAQRRAILRVVDEVELDDKSRERARFAVSLLTEAVAPTNTLVGNPGALAKAVETRGHSLVSGVRHMGHDLRRNGGMPSLVDARPFEIGRNLAATPGQVVHRAELFELIQYAPAGDRVHERPLVAIPPQINKYYITDISPGRSLVEHMVGRGVPYFAVSWRNPTPAQRDWDLDAYVAACKEALEVACEVTGSEQANVLGLCAGGITLACLLGHLAATGEELVHSATFMVAALDTAHESMVGSLASKRAIEAARASSQRTGVLDGRSLGRVFAWLRPNDLVWGPWVNNYLLGQNPPAFDILYWNDDNTSLPAALHSDFLDLYSTNGLMHAGELEVLGTRVDLRQVTCDAYVLAGSADHIVPWGGAYQTTQVLGGDVRFVLSTSGHIQAIVNPAGNKKSSFLTDGGPQPADPAEWQEAAVKHEGSWWEDWAAWLSERSGGSRPAPTTLGSSAHPPLEAAPGRYVYL